ncbi:MAG: branched-chain amino acid transaminase [Thermoanaerobaculia bacterium]
MAGPPRTDYVWMDGELIPWEDARVHVLTHTLHYGLGIFEGTRAYEQTGGGSCIFRLDDHLKRLMGSARICNIEMPFDRDRLRQATIELVAANGHASSYIRHLGFLSAGTMGLYPRDNPVSLCITTWPWGAYLGEEGLKNGIRAKISSFTRPFPNAVMTKGKIVGNYVNSIMAKREVVHQGYDEAILMDTNGFVTECSGENLFTVRNGVVRTPVLTSGLMGITRDTVLKIARDLGHQTTETILTRDELYISDEVFMSGTAAEVTPVREVDDRPIGDGKAGPVTMAIQKVYFETIRGERPEYGDWLTPVPLEASVHGSAAL